MEFSYYPGCTLRTKAKELSIYAVKSAEALGVTLTEPEEWQCCGAVYPLSKDEIASKLSAVRTLADARDRGVSLVTLCSACHHVMVRVNNDMATDENIRTKANNYLEYEVPYSGETEVIHYLTMLRDKVGFDNIKKAVKNPLKGRKIGAYYGCLLLRPSSVMQFDSAENPTIIEDFIKAIGATPVIYEYRNECCGGYISATDKAQATKNVDKIINNAKEHGAEEIITACPLCLYNLKQNATKAISVTYFTELLAEALGVK